MRRCFAAFERTSSCSALRRRCSRKVWASCRHKRLKRDRRAHLLVVGLAMVEHGEQHDRSRADQGQAAEPGVHEEQDDEIDRDSRQVEECG